MVKIKRDWHSEEFRRLVAIGDSITAGGWASCREKCWAELIASQISDLQSEPVELLNMGIGANLLSPSCPAYAVSSKPCGMERIERDIINKNPDLLIFAYGTNDARGGNSLEVYERDLKAAIARIREQINPLIVLMGPYHLVDTDRDGPYFNKADNALLDRFNLLMQKTAEELECLFADARAAIGHADWLVHNDGCHLNNAGHRAVASRIMEVLLRNCSGLAQNTKKLEEEIPPWRDESTLLAN